MNVTPRDDGKFDVRIRAVTNVMTASEAMSLSTEIRRVVAGISDRLSASFVERLQAVSAEKPCEACELPHPGCGDGCDGYGS